MKWFLTSFLLSVAAVTFLLWARLSNQEVSFIPADSLKVSEEQRPPYIDDSHLLVRTNACTIYQWPVFPLDTMLLFERQPEKPNCSSFRLEDAIHRINFTSVYLPPTLIDCKAFELSRKADDFWNNNKKLLWKQNAQSVSSKSHQILHFEGAENVFIKCKGMLTDEENEQQKVVPLIPLKTPKVWPESLPKLAFKVKNLYPQTNIVFIGIDSLSRLNFLRQMRKTAAFLEEHHFQTFYGHHKVGTNTRPNLFAMMLGISPAEYQARLPPSKLLDDYAFISKDFSTGGYLTSMIEDYFPYVLFEFDGAEGFTPDNYPMDYNIDPLGRNIRHSSRFKFESACYGNRLQVEYYLDLLLDQMAAFRARKQPHLIWSHFSGLTHDHFNGAQNFDRPFLKLMQNIFARGYSNDTVLVFYSDHHNRLSPEVSKLGSHHHESNLPQMAIWVPESLLLLTEDGGEGWIDGKQVRAVMKANSRQLTSMFDVYSTLQHLLYGRPVAHPKGVSLFTPISPTRSCSQAGIPPQYCQCTEYRNFEDAAMAAAIAECLIKYINEKKVPSLQYPLCGRLQLGEVVSVRRYLHDNALEEHGLLLGMRFKAAPPSGALFEASVQVNSTDMTSLTAITVNNSISMSDLQLYGEIDRLDRYREQSACVAGTEAERFCYCLPSA